MKTQFFAERANFRTKINLHMLMDPMDGRARTMARPVVFEAIQDEAQTLGEPMLVLSNVAAQSLIDELWQVGLRPTQGQQSEGQMAATTKHLNDMRTLVSALAKVELPKP